jgi:hypothetical protein
MTLLRDPDALLSHPDAWCPTSKELSASLEAQERVFKMRDLARLRANSGSPVGKPSSGRPKAGKNRANLLAGGLPFAVFENGVVVMEDDGTLLSDDNLPDLQGFTLEFIPSGGGTRYDASIQTLNYDTSLGTQVVTDQRGFVSYQATLTQFAFPFGGTGQSDLFLTTNIGIYFSTPQAPQTSQLYTEDVLFDTALRIAPLLQGTSLWGWNIYFREDTDRAVITWQAADGGNELDVQAVLFSDGRIRFSYNKLVGIEWGTMVIYPDTTSLWSSWAAAADLSDPVDVTLGLPEDPALDYTDLKIEQVPDTELLRFTLTLAGAPDPTSREIYYQIDIVDEPSDPGAVYQIIADVQGGNIAWSTVPTLRLNGNQLIAEVLQSKMALSDGDFTVRVYDWVYTDQWYFADYMEGNDLTFPTTPAPMMVDVTNDFPLSRAVPIYEAFTIPGLRAYSVYDAFRQIFGDPPIDGLPIYQNFHTDIIFYAGAYSTVGNAGADGIGTGSSADPKSPALLHMNALGYGWNSWPEGRGMVLSHEFGHHWLYFVQIMENGTPTYNLNPTGAHPAGWVSLPAAAQVVSPTDCSCMGGTTWTDNNDGTFTSPPFSSYGYSWNELYLMGLATRGEVPDWYYIQDSVPGLPDAYWPPENTTVSGTRVDVSLQQVIDALGPRVPRSGLSPHDFNVVFVLVVRPGQWSSSDSAELGSYCTYWSDFFHTATDQRGTITCNKRMNHAPEGIIDTPAANIRVPVGSSVDFAGTGTDPDGDVPLAFAWDFGGAGPPSSAAEDPGLLQFNTMGTYTVTFTVTDSLGLADPIPDVRTVEVTCAAPTGQIGNTLKVVKTPAGGIEFHWQDFSPGPDDYVLLSSLIAPGPFSTISGSGLAGAAGIIISMPPESRVFYHVAGRTIPDCIGPY